jgi:ribonuclease Z
VVEFQAGGIWNEDGMRVTAVEVDHRPVRYAFGFLFEANGKKLVFSGDTTYCPALIEAAHGADVLVHECFIHLGAPMGTRTAEGTRNVAGYHTLSSEVGKIATAAGVRCLVLNHFVPVDFDEPAVLAEVRRDYSGPIILDVETGEIRYAGLVMGLPISARLDAGKALSGENAGSGVPKVLE